MRAVVQRVTSARVTVDDRITGQIDRGLLVLLGVEQQDGVVCGHLHATLERCGLTAVDR